MPASELPPSTVPALPAMRKPEITEHMIEAEAERLYYSTRKPRECFSGARGVRTRSASNCAPRRRPSLRRKGDLGASGPAGPAPVCQAAGFPRRED